MAKRFTDTDKWKKPFIRGLQGPYKLLWLYICDDCDHAGIWHVDMDVAAIRIGEKITEKTAIEVFGTKIIVFASGEKWFLPSFLDFQYPGGLNEKNKVHNSIIQILTKYNLIDENNKPLASPLQAPLNGAMDKDMDKDKEMEKDKDKDKEKEKPPKVEIIFPWSDVSFLIMWKNWKEYKSGEHKFKYKTVVSEQMALKELCELSEGHCNNAIKIIEKSISKGWKGFFKLSKEDNATITVKSGKERESEIDDAINRHFGR